MATTILGPFAPVEDATPVVQAQIAPASSHLFVFAGTAREYFGIWTVNILLTVVTLGIYSPWALVRARRYFHGNTLLDGVAFGYHARPSQILKGRAIAVGLFGAYVLIATFYPWFDLLMYLVVLPAVVPWIVVRALRFSRRVSSHRNIRFGFVGTMREAFMVYVVFVACAISPRGCCIHTRSTDTGATWSRTHVSARPRSGSMAARVASTALRVCLRRRARRGRHHSGHHRLHRPLFEPHSA